MTSYRLKPVSSDVQGTPLLGVGWIPVCWIPGQARNDRIHNISGRFNKK